MGKVFLCYFWKWVSLSQVQETPYIIYISTDTLLSSDEGFQGMLLFTQLRTILGHQSTKVYKSYNLTQAQIDSLFTFQSFFAFMTFKVLSFYFCLN